jgi:hypothetical protein
MTPQILMPPSADALSPHRADALLVDRRLHRVHGVTKVYNEGSTLRP